MAGGPQAGPPRSTWPWSRRAAAPAPTRSMPVVPATTPVPEGERAGEHLGPYRLVERIGEGGMGVVHLAVDPSGKAVAVKVLRDHVAGDPNARERLAREFASLSRVRHEGVAGVVDADVHGPRPFIVTRYVRGLPLDEWIAQHGPLTGDALVRFGESLARSLDAIHAAGVVHRDLKPSNVLMPGGEPVVIDFGIAQIADESRLTRTGLVMGTPGFLPPELLDDGDVGEASDWWGWSATLAFAATGRLPFGRGPLDAVFHRVYSGEADLRGVDPALAALLRAGLDPRPARRPSHEQVVAGLDALVRGADAAAVTALVRCPGRSGSGERGDEARRDADGPREDARAASPGPDGVGAASGASSSDDGSAEGSGRAGHGAGPGATPAPPTSAVPPAAPTRSLHPADAPMADGPAPYARFRTGGRASGADARYPGGDARRQRSVEPRGAEAPFPGSDPASAHGAGRPEQRYPGAGPMGPRDPGVDATRVARVDATRIAPLDGGGPAPTRGAYADPTRVGDAYPGRPFDRAGGPRVGGAYPGQPYDPSRAGHAVHVDPTRVSPDPRGAHQAWSGSGPEGEVAGYPPRPDPRIAAAAARRANRARLVVLAGGAAFAAGFATFPTLTVLVGLVWAVFARTVGGSVESVVLRRHVRGVAGVGDVVRAVLVSPVRLVGACVSTGLLALVQGLFAGAGLFAGQAGSGMLRGRVPELTEAGPMLVAGLVTALVAWWGPGGRGLRGGSRWLVRSVLPGRWAPRVFAGLLGCAAIYLFLRTQASGAEVTWWPLSTDMLPSWWPF